MNMRTTIKGLLSISALLLGTQAWAIPIVGTTDSVNNTAEFDFSRLDENNLRVDLENTSNFDARITGFAFDFVSGLAAALGSVSGTLNDGGWVFSSDAIPGPDSTDAAAITGANLFGGDPHSGIAVGGTGVFGFTGTFASNLSISNIHVRFQQTGLDGEGSDKGVACTTCEPTVTVPEPSSLALIGLALFVVGFTARSPRRRRTVARGA